MSRIRIKIIISASILCGLTVNSRVKAELTEDFEDLKEPTTKKSEIQHEGQTDGELSGTTDSKTKPSKLPQDSKSTQKNNKARTSKAGMVKFWSKSLSGFRDQGSLALEEDVVVTQDDIRIEADKATIFFEKTTNEVKEVHAVGTVRFQRFDPETGQPIRAEGKEAIFDNAKRMVTMKGEPVLHRGEDVVRGKVIYYNLTNGWVKADRVEGVVQPAVKKAGSK